MSKERTKEVTLTEKDLKILEKISRVPYGLSPTEIGMRLNQPYNSASSYCNASLKRLMAAGKIVKIKTDKVRYKLHRNGKN